MTEITTPPAADHVAILHVQFTLIKHQVTKLQVHHLTDILPVLMTTNFCPNDTWCEYIQM